MTEEVIEQNPTENVLQTEPIVVPAPEPAAEVVETPVEPVVEPVETTQDQEDKRKNPWFLKRISAEAEARRLAEQRATDAEAMLERLQAGKEPDPATPPQDIDRLVNSRAAALRLADDRNALVQAGQTKFGASEFNQAAEIAAACGCVSDDFVADVLAVDRSKAHEIYMKLAEEPERAAQIAQMDSRRRIAELTRMTMTINAPAAPAPKAPAAPAKQVSRAPAPPPPVEPSATKTVPWYSDEASDADFDKGFYNPDRLKKRQRL